MISVPALRLGKRVELPNRSAQEWLPLAEAVRMLEVGAIPLQMLTPAERDRVRRAEEEFFNGLRFPIQRIAMPVPLDLEEFTEGLLDQAKRDPHRERAALLTDKANHVRSLISEKHLVLWRNLVIIPDEGQGGAERVHYVKERLGRMGLSVRELDPGQMAQAWYELLNPQAAAQDRIHAGEYGAMVDAVDRITPREGFVFADAKAFKVGSLYCRVMAIRNYPRHVTQQQLADIYRMDRRVVIVQHIHPTNSADMQKELSNSIAELGGKSGVRQSAYHAAVNHAKLRDAHKLMKKLAGENHAILDFCMVVLLRCDSLEELEELTQRVITRLEGKAIQARALHPWEFEAGLLTCLPVVQNPLRELTRRNLPAESLPAAFPYSNAELSHGSGYVHGINKTTGNLVILDPWKATNPHCVYISTSGGGKTFTLNELLIQFWAAGIQILQLDIEGDKGRLCEQLKGQRVRLAPHGGNYINPMEVRRPPLDPTLFLGSDAEEPANALAATIQRQKVVFRLMMPDITRVEMAYLEMMMRQCYEERGITYDNYHRFVGRPHAWPTWTDLLAKLGEHEELQALWAMLQTWVGVGTLAGMLDLHTNVNLDNQFVQLDLHDIMGDMEARGVLFFLAMTFLWDEVNRDWRQKKILDIDELGILADSEDALQFVWKVAKCARRRRCRLQVATQDPADFLSGRNPAALKYALGIINNCATRVLGYLEPKALEQVAQVVQLTDAEKTLISNMHGKPQEKLITCGGQRAHVEVVASLNELRILDPQQYTELTGKPV